MELYELDLKHLIEVRLMRLNKPKFQTTNSPLYSEYHPNLPNSPDRIHDKLSVFDTPENFPISNMLTLTSSFGRVLYCEDLDALLIVNNLSRREEIRIKDITVKISNEALPNYTTMFKKYENVLFHGYNLHISADKFFTHKLSLCADVMCKYNIEVNIQYTCSNFNQEYQKHSVGKVVKNETVNYRIDADKGIVIRKFYKKFLFDTNLPFRIRDKFFNRNLEQGILELNTINLSSYNLHVVEFSLSIEDSNVQGGGKRSDEPIIISASNQENSKSQNEDFYSLDPFEDMSMEPEEEFNMVYVFKDIRKFLLVQNFVVKVGWTNMWDTKVKYLNYVFKNKIANELVLLTCLAKPSRLTANEMYQISFELENVFRSKQTNLEEIRLQINCERNSERELDIVDVVPSVRRLT